MSTLYQTKLRIEARVRCKTYFLRSDGNVELRAREVQYYRDEEAGTWLGTGRDFNEACHDALETLQKRATGEREYAAGDVWYGRIKEAGLGDAP